MEQAGWQACAKREHQSKMNIVKKYSAGKTKNILKYCPSLTKMVSHKMAPGFDVSLQQAL